MSVVYRTFDRAMLPEYIRVKDDSGKEMPQYQAESVERMEVYFLKDPDFDPEGIFLAFRDGRMVGFSEAEIQKTRIEAGMSQGFVGVEVVPSERGQGVEEVLMSKALGYLRTNGIREAIYGFHPHIPWRLKLANGSGFAYLRRFYRLKRGMAAPVPDVPFPGGIDVERVPGRNAPKDYVLEWAETFNRAFVDHFNFAPSDPQNFLNWTEVPGENLVFALARAGGKPVGVCLSEIEHGTDGGTGWVDILGVVPEARRNGLGRALLADGLRWISSQRAKEALLGVDAQNEKALTLYRSLGFEPMTESHVYNRIL
ncbi:MAG: GNAT family N-acetyltransferase [Methanobacteriota archaeon]